MLATSGRRPRYGTVPERERAIGFGSFTYDFIKLANDLDYDLDSERMQLVEEYGFECVGRPVLKLHDGVGGEISEQNGAIKMTDINNQDQSDKYRTY